MNAVGIIPARMNASRFPGKPMALIQSMPMVGHCYHRAKLASGLSSVYVATCDQVIYDYISEIGGRAIMTSELHNRATTRTAEALEIIEQQTGETIDIVAMVQGDEPLIAPENISNMLTHFADPEVNIVNLMSRFKSYESFLDRNNVKVVVDRFGNALYFSREPIPSAWRGWAHLPCYMQTGVIAFRRDALLDFNGTNETILEKIESIDMNRVLENGGNIHMVSIENWTIGVDTPEELILAENYLLTDSVLKRYLR